MQLRVVRTQSAADVVASDHRQVYAGRDGERCKWHNAIRRAPPLIAACLMLGRVYWPPVSVGRRVARHQSTVSTRSQITGNNSSAPLSKQRLDECNWCGLWSGSSSIVAFCLLLPALSCPLTRNCKSHIWNDSPPRLLLSISFPDQSTELSLFSLHIILSFFSLSSIIYLTGTHLSLYPLKHFSFDSLTPPFWFSFFLSWFLRFLLRPR